MMFSILHKAQGFKFQKIISNLFSKSNYTLRYRSNITTIKITKHSTPNAKFRKAKNQLEHYSKF